jgi:hypothetical protein
VVAECAQALGPGLIRALAIGVVDYRRRSITTTVITIPSSIPADPLRDPLTDTPHDLRRALVHLADPLPGGIHPLPGLFGTVGTVAIGDSLRIGVPRVGVPRRLAFTRPAVPMLGGTVSTLVSTLHTIPATVLAVLAL